MKMPTSETRMASLDEAMNDTLGWLARVNTKISYLYRDADNYKMRHEVVIAGSMSEEQEKAIEDSLDEGVYFIPSQVGLPDDRFGSVTAADHPWFEWVGVEPTADRPTLHVTAEELTAKFVDATNRMDGVRGRASGRSAPVQRDSPRNAVQKRDYLGRQPRRG